MLLPAPPLYPRKRKAKPKRTPPATPPPSDAPVLVAAAFDAGQMFVTLTFDRDVDPFNVAPEASVVFDGSNATEYRSTTDLGQPNPTSVEILMLEAGEFTGTGVRMTAVAANGIVSAPGGIEWAGVADVVLPFP